MAGRTKVTVELTPEADAIIGGQTRLAAQRGAQAMVRYARSNIKAAGRVHTGEMGRQTKAIPDHTSPPLVARYRVETQTPYAAFQEFGTRAHGPKRAKFMRFQIRGRGPVIYAKWVRGVKPAHFMRDAAAAVRVEDFAT